MQKKTEEKNKNKQTEEIAGLTFFPEEDTENEFIPEVFGMNGKKYMLLLNEMRHFFLYQLERDDATDSKVQLFKDFLQSDAFKKCEFPLLIPENYLLLGMAWAFVLKKIEEYSARNAESNAKHHAKHALMAFMSGLEKI